MAKLPLQEHKFPEEHNEKMKFGKFRGILTMEQIIFEGFYDCSYARILYVSQNYSLPFSFPSSPHSFISSFQKREEDFQYLTV